MVPFHVIIWKPLLSKQYITYMYIYIYVDLIIYVYSYNVQYIIQVQKAMDEKNFAEAIALRGRSFTRNLETYRLLSRMRPPVEKDNLSGGRVFNLAVMNVGAPACGVNAVIRAFVRVGIYHNCRVFTIQDSFEGLAQGLFKVPSIFEFFFFGE